MALVAVVAVLLDRVPRVASLPGSPGDYAGGGRCINDGAVSEAGYTRRRGVCIIEASAGSTGRPGLQWYSCHYHQRKTDLSRYSESSSAPRSQKATSKGIHVAMPRTGTSVYTPVIND